MSKKYYSSVSVIFFIIIFILWSDTESLTIVTEEWAPYNYTENGILKGFSSEIVQNIMKELDIKSQITMLPSLRTTQLLNTHSQVMMFSMMRYPERENKYKWIGPIGSGAIYFYKRKGSDINISSLDDAMKVGLIACRNGGTVFNKLTKKGFNNLDTTAIDGMQMYSKLINGRCDLGISDTDLGVKYLLEKMGHPQGIIERTDVKLVESDLYIACSRDISDNEINRWQQALEKLKRSETYLKIFDKYN